MESISRISSMLETARDLTLEAARDAGAARKPLRVLPAAQIRKLLDSRNEREVLDGLRRVIAMQYTSPLHVTLPFFPYVLKTLSQQTSSTRPLVYAYLLHHAEADPDTALLSVNTVQKSLSDSNPRVRAMALKAMSGIQVPVISQIVSLAIKKGVADMSPVVRKTAAFACVKCIRLDPSTLPQVIDYVQQLLGDKQYYVAGAAVVAFNELCPERLDLIHPNYRSLVRKLVDMDEWGQLATLRLMTMYARKCFPFRTGRVKKIQATQIEKAEAFYEEEKIPEESDDSEYENKQVLDPDLELLLNSALPLLQSRTSAVVVAVVRAYLYLAPSFYLHHAIGPLIALLRGPQDIQQVGLYNIVQVCLAQPNLLVPYFRHFLFRSTEAPQVWRLKLEVLTLIFPHCNLETQGLTLAELEHFSQGNDQAMVRESVRAIGRCAQTTDTKTSTRCLKLLLRQVHSPDQRLVAEALEVVRHLIQRDPQNHRKTVVRLAKNLDTLSSPAARASVIWLVGEFGGLEHPQQSIAPDVLRILVRGYTDESVEVRQQIVLLAAKVYLHWLNTENDKRKEEHKPLTPVEPSDSITQAPNNEEDGFQVPGTDTDVSTEQPEKPHPISLLYHHVLLLARYTPSYDLRDRARLFRALLSVRASTELASLLLLAPKPVPQAPSPSESRKQYMLGSSSLIIGDEVGVSGLKGYEDLPDWVEAGDEPDPNLRDRGDVEYAGTQKAAAGRVLDDAVRERPSAVRSGGKEKTLDSWLAESEGSEGEDSSAEEESDVDEEESSEEEDSGGSEEESEDEESTDDDDDDENDRLVK